MVHTSPQSVLIERMRAGNRRALARLITLVENGDAESRQILAHLHQYTGRAHIIGITGAPGAGKSTLVNALITELRQQGQTVAILAVDPSSPLTGGAILGDRIRMQSHIHDTGVFIRSMASRGQLGGIARTTSAAAIVLDAAGFDIILIETVGAGQAEVAIAAAAQTTIVVEVPGLGDDIQANKAGMLEIADLFVVNKADREGADATKRHLLAAMQLGGPPRNGWRPPVIMAIATQQHGISEILAAIQAHRQHLRTAGSETAHQSQRAEQEIKAMLHQLIHEQIEQHLSISQRTQLIHQVATHQIDAYTAAQVLLRLIIEPQESSKKQTD